MHSGYYSLPNSEKKDPGALILPGDTYKVQIVGIHQGVEGAKKIFSSHLQPNAPTIVKTIQIAGQNLVKLLVRWHDQYNQYTKGYVMEYRSKFNLLLH